MNDFDQHPYSALFGGTLDNHAGQTFYAVLAGAFQTNAAAIATAAGNGTAALATLLTGTVGPGLPQHVLQLQRQIRLLMVHVLRTCLQKLVV